MFRNKQINNIHIIFGTNDPQPTLYAYPDEKHCQVYFGFSFLKSHLTIHMYENSDG